MLAFDQASKTGWAAWDGTSPAPLIGTATVSLWGIEDGAMLERFRLWLGHMITAHEPQVLAHEAPSLGPHQDAPTIYRQAMLLGMIRWAAHRRQVPCYAIHQATWRKTFLGFGARGKRTEKIDWKALSLARAAELGWNPPDHNAADAGGILDHVLHVELKLLTPWRGQAQSPLFLPEQPNAR